MNYAGTHETAETRVAAVVDLYGPVDYGKLAMERRDHPERFNVKGIARHAANGGGIRFFGVEALDEAGLAKLRSLSPIGGVHAGMTPFLAIHGSKDDQVSFAQSTEMCEAMHKAKAGCELITVHDVLLSIYRPMQSQPPAAMRVTFSLDLLLFRVTAP